MCGEAQRGKKGRVNALYALPNILISLSTRESSILSSFIELQTNRQQKVSKKTKKTKKSTRRLRG